MYNIILMTHSCKYFIDEIELYILLYFIDTKSKYYL